MAGQGRDTEGRDTEQSPATSTSLIAAIVEREPVSLSSLQPVTPPSLDRLVRRCLAKSPDDRWDTAHDVADELRWIEQTVSQPGPGAAGGAPRRERLWLVTGTVAVAVVSVLVGGLAGRRWLAPVPRPSVVRSLLDVRPAEELNAGGYNRRVLTPGGSRTALTWTADGRSLVFVGRQQGVQRLYVRPLDGEEARVLEGTEGAQVPVVSPNGQWVAFWANGAIRRIPLAGGPAATLVGGLLSAPRGIACGGDDRLFYADHQGSAIWSAQPDHAPVALTKRREDEVSVGLPHLLPGGGALLYTVRHRQSMWGDEEVVAHVFATGERKALLRDAADARYVPSGHLVFLRRGVLHAVAFDALRLEIRSAPEPVLESVVQALTDFNSDDLTGAGQFSVASTGALAFFQGGVIPHRERQLVTVDRQGAVSPLDAPKRSYGSFLSLSPDGFPSGCREREPDGALHLALRPRAWDAEQAHLWR